MITFDCPHIDNLPVVQNDRRGLQRLHQIAEFWKTNPETPTLFSNHVFSILNETDLAFCFGCLWLPRVTWEDIRKKKQQYGLERAHLQDASSGGSNYAINVIPLCEDCHWEMTCGFMGCRDCAILWVQTLQDRYID